MISNERPSPYGHRPHQHSISSKPSVVEDTLKSDKVQIERKTFVFTLKENPRGRFLRITEDVKGRRDTVNVPAPGIEDFSRLVADLMKSVGERSLVAACDPYCKPSQYSETFAQM